MDLETIIIIGGIGLLFALIINLRGRVWHLEQQLNTQTSQARQTQNVNTSASPAYTESPQSIAIPQTPSQTIPIRMGPSGYERAINWIKEDWLLKLGALLLLIGFGWLVTYAFLNNWIGPMGRIALGIIAGSGILLLGWWRIQKYLHQGSIFLVLGSTVILLTIFAAREIYDFFTPASALIVMFLSVAFVALASVKFNTRTLALVSLILAGITPLLTNGPPNYVGLFSYLLAITIGTIWIVALRGWRILTSAALILVALYSLPHLSSYTSADADTMLLFAFIFTAVFFITNTLGILKLKGSEIMPDLLTAGGTGLFLITWIMTTAQDEWQSLLLASWMIVFSVGAFLLFKVTDRREPFYMYAAIGIAMLAAATSTELEGAALTIAYTIESAAAIFVAYYILRDIHIVERMSIILAGPMLLSMSSIVSRNWNSEIIHKDFFVLLILSATLLLLGWFFQDKTVLTQNKKPSPLVPVYFITGSIYGYILLWLALHAGFPNSDTGTMIALVIYTIIGLATYIYGRMEEKKEIRVYGALLLGFVVGRLLLIDVWQMELTGRIITFFLVGMLLMSTAFIGRKNT